VPVKCSVRDCERDAVFFMEGLGLCAQHMGAAARLVGVVQEVGGRLAAAAQAAARAPQEARAPARPAAVQAQKRVVRKRLRTDAEIEEVVSKRLERSGSAVVMSILGNFSVDRGEFRTASERVVSVMSRMVERDPARLELTGSGVRTVIRLRQHPKPPEAPEQRPAEG
jgi:hypothetical protein